MHTKVDGTEHRAMIWQPRWSSSHKTWYYRLRYEPDLITGKEWDVIRADGSEWFSEDVLWHPQTQPKAPGEAARSVQGQGRTRSTSKDPARREIPLAVPPVAVGRRESSDASQSHQWPPKFNQNDIVHYPSRLKAYPAIIVSRHWDEETDGGWRYTITREHDPATGKPRLFKHADGEQWFWEDELQHPQYQESVRDAAYEFWHSVFRQGGEIPFPTAAMTKQSDQEASRGPRR
jgi:hypothetical protein